MNQTTKEQIELHRQRHAVRLDAVLLLAKMSGKVKFLTELDLGSITRNETAQALAKDLEEVTKLVDRIGQENSWILALTFLQN